MVEKLCATAVGKMKLDVFMDEYSKRFNTGKCRRRSKAYQSKLGHFNYLKQRKYSRDKWDKLTDEQKTVAKQEMKQTRDQMMNLEFSS